MAQIDISMKPRELTGREPEISTSAYKNGDIFLKVDTWRDYLSLNMSPEQALVIAAMLQSAVESITEKKEVEA